MLSNTHKNADAWQLYNKLLAGIPQDATVVDYCLGTHWSYMEATCGMGVSYTCKGGARRTHTQDLRGASLSTAAKLAKSWCFEEATLGIAALNAWYSQAEQIAPLNPVYDPPNDIPEGQHKMDAFDMQWNAMQGKRVAVVGHFPRIERIAEIAELTVLERNCSSELDTPDPACEYIIPDQDFLFLTGVTLINKTAPRLLKLSENAKTIFVGPSVVPSPALFDYGVDTLCGSVVLDSEKTRFAIKNGSGKLFGEAVQMMSIECPS